MTRATLRSKFKVGVSLKFSEIVLGLCGRSSPDNPSRRSRVRVADEWGMQACRAQYKAQQSNAATQGDGEEDVNDGNDVRTETARSGLRARYGICRRHFDNVAYLSSG